MLDFLAQAVAAHSRRLDDHLSGGGPAPYVRRFLHTAPAAPSDACGRS